MYNYSEQYGAQVNRANANYPYGQARNRRVTGDLGTPLEQKWLNDLWGFFQDTLNEAGVEPNNTAERVGNSQILTALRQMMTGIQRSAVPTTIAVPPIITINDYDIWEYTNYGESYALRQGSLGIGPSGAEPGRIVLPFNIPVGGARIIGFQAHLQGAGGHTALPWSNGADPPTFRLSETKFAETTLIAEMQDTSLSVGAYENPHTIGAVASYDVTPFAQYAVEINGEAGTIFREGLTVFQTYVILELL